MKKVNPVLSAGVFGHWGVCEGVSGGVSEGVSPVGGGVFGHLCLLNGRRGHCEAREGVHRPHDLITGDSRDRVEN